MSFNQTYYLDIDSNYRDESVYPNPTDFTIPFKTNTSTGYYALGEPLNTDSYFEQVSIDPNFANDNINITNGYVTNIKILETVVFVSGVIYPGNTTFRYLNTGILSLTGVCNVSAFLGRFDITELGDIPYVFNWIVYSDNTGPVNSSTTRSTFTFDLLDNIYWMFDSRNQYVIIYYRNRLSNDKIKYNTLLNVDNGAGAIYYPASIDDNIWSDQVGLFIMYLSIDGNKGTYDNRDWGYHVINDPRHRLNSYLSNGSFNLNVDNGNNIITTFNLQNTIETNAFITTTGRNTSFYYMHLVFASRATTGPTSTGANLVVGPLPINVTGTLQQYNFFGTPFGISEFSNTGGNYILGNMVYAAPGAVNGARTQPFYTISKDSNTGPVLHSIVSMPNAVFNVSQPLILFPITYSGTLYLVISYARYSFATSTSINYPIDIFKFSEDMTTGTLIASTTGGVSYLNRIYPQLVNDDLYIPVRKPENNVFIMYKYNFPTNAMIDVATGTSTGATDNYILLSYQQSGFIYNVVTERIGITAAKNVIYRFDPITNAITIPSTYFFKNVSTPINYIAQTRKDKKIYLYYSYLNTVVTIVDVSNPFNPLITDFNSRAIRMGLCYLEYKLTNGSYRTLLSGGYVEGFAIYDITDINSPQLINLNNNGSQIYYISPSGTFYGWYDFRIYNAQAIIKIPLFEPINLYSTHYSQNVQQTIPLSQSYNRMTKFNINNYSYFVLYSNSNINIFNTTSIVNIFSVYNFNYSFNIYNQKSYYFNGYIYILLVDFANNLIIYKSNSINESSPLITNFTTFYTLNDIDLLDATLGYSNGFLFLVTTYYKKYIIYKYISNFTQVLLYNETNPNLVIPYSDILYNTLTNINYIILYKNNFVSTVDAQGDIYKINNDGTISFQTNVTVVYGATYKTVNIVRSNNIYSFKHLGAFAIPGTGTSYVTQQDINLPVTSISYNANDIGLNNQPFDAIPYSTTFLAIAGATGTININRGTNLINTIIPPGNVAGVSIFQNPTQTYVILLLTNSTLYCYDLTNLTYSLTSQNLTTTQSKYTFEPGLALSFIHTILQDGTPSTTNYIGNSLYDPDPISNFVNINNSSISSDYSNLIIAGNWEKNSYFFQNTSTGYIKTNYLSYNSNSANSFILNSTINLKNRYVIPLIGPISNIINKLQINNSLNYTSFVGTSSSKYFYIYNPQISGTLQIPEIIQYVFNIISTSNGFLISIDNDTGTLVNNLLVFTNDQSRNITLLDLAIDDYQTSIIGTSNANNLRILSNDILYDQVLYSNIEASSSFNIFMFVISNSGSLLYSNLIDCGPNVSVSIQDIKQDSELNRIYFTPYFTLLSGTGSISIYNRDGTLSKRDTIIGGNNFYSLVFQYVYDPLYTDKNGVQYSQIVYINPPTYPFIDENFNNYILFLIGDIDNVDVNGNYYVRYNEYDGEKYKLILNTIIDPISIIKQFSTINNITGSNNYFNMQLSSSYLEGYVIYDLNTVPNPQNQIVATTEIAAIDIDSFYYFMIPFQSSTGTINKLIPITNIDINSAGNFVFTVDNINDLRVSLPSGAFYGPYLPIVVPNDKLYSVIPFFGSSIFTPIYYNITLDSITLPNRPIKNLPIPGSRGFNDIPFFYVSIYPVDDEGNYDPETVNVVYTNTKLLVLPSPIFKIQSFSPNPDDNFVTFNSITTPIIKFDKNYANLRTTIYDPDGEVILFDTSATKESDADFLYGLLPTTLVNMYLRITLTKR